MTFNHNVGLYSIQVTASF